MAGPWRNQHLWKWMLKILFPLTTAPSYPPWAHRLLVWPVWTLTFSHSAVTALRPGRGKWHKQQTQCNYQPSAYVYFYFPLLLMIYMHCWAVFGDCSTKIEERWTEAMRGTTIHCTFFFFFSFNHFEVRTGCQLSFSEQIFEKAFSSAFVWRSND